MRSSWTLFLVRIGVFMTAFAARHILVPDVVPISVEVEQAPWALQAVFLLLAIEIIAGFGAILVIVASPITRLTSMLTVD